MSMGWTPHGTISKRKKIYWEAQLFALIRSFKDGITFLKFNLNFDKYISDHTPAFQIEITILNLYFHFWIYQNNWVIEEEQYEIMCKKLSMYGITSDEFDDAATNFLDEGIELTECYNKAYDKLLTSIHEYPKDIV